MGHVWGDTDHKHTGGNVIEHESMTRIELRKGDKNQRNAKIMSSSYLPPEQISFVINKHGITDYAKS